MPTQRNRRNSQRRNRRNSQKGGFLEWLLGSKSAAEPADEPAAEPAPSPSSPLLPKQGGKSKKPRKSNKKRSNKKR